MRVRVCHRERPLVANSQQSLEDSAARVLCGHLHHFLMRPNRELGAGFPHSCLQSLSHLVPMQGVLKYVMGGFLSARLGRAGKDTDVNARCTLMGGAGDPKCSSSTPLEQLGQLLNHSIRTWQLGS